VSTLTFMVLQSRFCHLELDVDIWNITENYTVDGALFGPRECDLDINV
jgi:hypothetical protein